MSVFIPGMEFPQSCGECPFQASRWTGDFCSAGQFMIGADCDPRDKHEKCPLVEVETPHGRLIDADALRKSVLSQCEMVDALGVPEMSQIAELMKNGLSQEIEKAETIIEAEGGGEDG